MASAPLAEACPSDAYPGIADAARVLGLGTADWVRLESVALRLLSEGISSDDPRVPLWFAAALCRSAEQRRAFLHALHPPPPPPPLPPTDPEDFTAAKDRQAVEQFEEQRRRVVLISVGSVAAALLAVFLLLKAYGGPTDSPMVSLSNSLAATTRVIQQSIPAQARTLVADWGAIIALLAILAAAVGYWFWRRRRVRTIKAQFAPEPDKAAPLALRHQDTRLFASQTVRAGLRRLRRHRSQPSGRLDIRASIAATIRSGGQPQARFRGRWLMPEYLLMTEREAPRDHLAVAGAALAQRIAQENVAIGHYEFLGRPDRLRAAGGEAASIPLASVLARHADARSMLLAEGFDLREGPLTPAWAERITDAGPVVHLNPRLGGGQAESETLLAEDGIDSFPITGRGIAAMAQRLADPRAHHGLLAKGPARFDLPRNLGGERRLLLAEEAPRAMVVAGVLEDLAAWLDADSYRWFAALSLFPYLEPGLTLYLGSHLEDANGDPILTDDRFLAIARLPWMRAGSMPWWLRLELAHSLDPATLASATAAIQAFLLPAIERDEAEEISIEHGRDPVRRRLLLTWLANSPESEFHDPILIDMLKGRRPDQLGVRPAEALARRLDRMRRDPMLRFYAVVAASLALTMVVRPPLPSVMRDTGEMQTVNITEMAFDPAPVPTPSDTPTETPSPTAGPATPTPGPTAGPAPSPTPVTPLDPPTVFSPGPFIVYFDWDKSDINPTAAALLDYVVANYALAPGSQIMLVGYSDRRPSAAYAVGMSQRRADSVRRYLTSRGVPDSVISAEARGSFGQVDTADGVREPQNRRVEITFGPGGDQQSKPPQGSSAPLSGAPKSR